ncbi:MAG: hypothetical protein IJ733_12295 [Lachnospiraceae bacterium]|nr:hypothetical protein [Lachnospiraceae bacterium]
MNSSRKILNKQKQEELENKAVKVPEKSTKKPGRFSGNLKPVILTTICIVIVLVLCIGVAVAQLKPKVVVTVDKTKLTMNDMMFPIYEVEKEYAPLNAQYEQFLGSSFWEQDYQGDGSSTSTALTGVSNSVGFKQQIMNSEVSYIILSGKAKDEKMSLTDEEKADAHKKADKAIKGLSGMQKLRLDITKSKLYERFETRALAKKYKDSKQEELNKDIKEDDVTKDISKTDYRQYDIQYYAAKTTEEDDDGNTTKLGADKLSQLKAVIEKIGEKAKTESDFTKLLDDADKEDVEFKEDASFTESAGWSYLSDANLKKLKKLKNGEVSEPFYDEDAGYYLVVKMINNNSDEAYKTACDNAIKQAQQEAFDTWYQKEQESHKIKINTDIWTDVNVGYVTTEIVTLDDINDMEDSSDESSEN